MKRRPLSIALALVLVLVVGVLVSACGGSDTTTTTAAPATTATTVAPASTDTTAATTATTAASTVTTAFTGTVIKLKYADQNAETGWVGKSAANPWLDKVEQATGGQVKIERFFGQTLFPGKDTWESLKAGIADLAWCMHQYWANLTPLAEVVTLPFMPFTSSEQGGAVMWQLYKEFPSISKQFADNHPVALWASSPFYLVTTKKAVRTPEDLKGLKIRTLGGPPTQMMEALGAVPVAMPMPDVYQALQTGVLDGVLANWESIYSFKIYDEGKYLTLVPFHTGLFGISFNNNSWNALPDNVKTAIDSVSGMEGSKFWGKNMFDTAAAAVKDILDKEGSKMEYITFTDEEINTVWKAKYGQPIWDAWVKKMEAAGYTDAKAILDRCLELIEKGVPQQ
jgi:TRAP-type C4-dicarboxylate transport system substrate-binding protein